MSSSTLLLRCRGSAASSRLGALAGGSGAGASFWEAGWAAALAPLLFLGGGGFSASSSLEELSLLLLPESLPLSEESLLSESLDDESLSEEESESPVWRSMCSVACCCAQVHACLYHVEGQVQKCYAAVAVRPHTIYACLGLHAPYV